MKARIAGIFLCISALAVGALPAAADFQAGLSHYRHGNYSEALR